MEGSAEVNNSGLWSTSAVAEFKR